MADQGWISIHRKLKECWIYQDKPFDRTHAWIDLLLSANHQDKKVRLGNELVEVKRGSFVTSQLKLMDKWGWGKSKLVSFLTLISTDGMIQVHSTKKFTIITILNYETYQNQTSSKQYVPMDNEGSQTAVRPQTDHKQTIKQPQPDHKTAINNNDNNVNKNIYTSDFEEFYKLYPNPWNKAQSFKSWKALLKHGETKENILKAAANYIKYLKQKNTIDKQYIVRSTNFLGQHQEYKGYLEIKLNTPAPKEQVANAGAYKMI